MNREPADLWKWAWDDAWLDAWAKLDALVDGGVYRNACQTTFNLQHDDTTSITNLPTGHKENNQVSNVAH